MYLINYKQKSKTKLTMNTPINYFRVFIEIKSKHCIKNNFDITNPGNDKIKIKKRIIWNTNMHMHIYTRHINLCQSVYRYIWYPMCVMCFSLTATISAALGRFCGSEDIIYAYI